MIFELLVTVVVITLDGGLFDRAVHSFDLPIGPGMLNLGKPVFKEALNKPPF
jgi:hypothetical protein